MRLARKAEITMDLVIFVLFPVLLVNFFGPTLSFMISLFEVTSLFWLTEFLQWFGVAVPFVILTLFYCSLKASISKFEEDVSRTVILQAVVAAVIFAIWFERSFIHASGYLTRLSNFVIEMTYLAFIDILYLTFFVMLWKTVKKESNPFGLGTRFGAFYLWLNLAFFVSMALHSINRIDLVHYLRFHMPAELNWLFGYTPTILMSLTCLMGWILYLKTTKQGIGRKLLHVVLVLVPIVFAMLVETYTPRMRFIIITMIVWGSSYEFFRPLVYSLALVLSATGAFASFFIMLNARARARNRNQVRLGLASAVLAGMSLSLVSVLGVLTSLYVLLHGIMPRKETN
jgi:hypothetical protein